MKKEGTRRDVGTWTCRRLHRTDAQTGEKLFPEAEMDKKLKEYEEHRKEEGQRTKNLNAMRKQAKAQQTAIVTQEAAAKEAQSQAEEAAAKAAAERAAAEDAAKAAKMASFKRRKEKKLKEKEEFEARVKAKRESWTPLDDHFATTAGKAPTAAATPGEVRA